MADNPFTLPVSVDEYLHSVYEPDMNLEKWFQEGTLEFVGIQVPLAALL